MAIDIKKRVDVRVSLGTQPISTARFDVPLFLVGSAVLTAPELYRVYSDIDSVLEDYTDSSNAYKFASLAFGGKHAPTEIRIGQRSVTSWEITPAVANDTVYTLKLNAAGVTHTITYTSDADATDLEIVTGLTTAITTAGADVSASGTTTLILTPSVGKTLEVAMVTGNLASVPTYANTAVEALTAIRAVDETAFYIACDDHSEATQLALAQYCNSIKRMYVTSTQDAESGNPAATSGIGFELDALNYDYVSCMYHSKADTVLAEGAVIGAMASIEPGASTLTDKTLVGVPEDNLSATFISALESKNMPYYAEIAGVGSVFNSKVPSGQFFDTIVFAAEAEARIGENIYGAMKRASDRGSKLNYSNSGKEVINQKIMEYLLDKQSRDIIPKESSIGISIPKNADISDNDRANRFLPNVLVTFDYSNGIETVQVRAYVSV